MPTLRILVLAGSLAVPAAGPIRAAAPPGTADERPRRWVAFACPGGASLAAGFVTDDPAAPALVRPPGGPALTLPAQPSGSGFRYGDGAHELRGKGREVTWTAPASPAIVCEDAAP